MTPENQRDEDLKKAQAQLEADRFRAKKLLKDVPVSALRMNFLIEQLVCDYQIIRQSWEREKADLLDHLDDIYEEIDYSKARAEQTGDSPIDIIRDMKKEKAELEERVRELAEREQMHSDLRRENLDAHIECERNRIEELTRLKSRNEELEAENHRLRLTQNIKQCNHYAEGFVPKSEIDRLKAKVAELEKPPTDEELRALLFQNKHYMDLKAERDRLKAENERLRDFSKSYDVAENNVYQEAKKEIDRLTASLAMAHEALEVMKNDVGDLERIHGSTALRMANAVLSDPSGSLAFERWKAMEAVVEAARYLVKELEAPHQSIAHLVDTDDNAGQYLREALEALDAKGGVSETD